MATRVVVICHERDGDLPPHGFIIHHLAELWREDGLEVEFLFGVRRSVPADVAILGGGLVGLEIAEFLAVRGRAVTVLEEGEWLGPEMAIPRRWRTLHELRRHGARLHTLVRLEAIHEEGVVFHTSAGERQWAEVDIVILGTGVAPNKDLCETLGNGGAADCAKYALFRGYGNGQRTDQFTDYRRQPGIDSTGSCLSGSV